jgi:hypothetical protein
VIFEKEPPTSRLSGAFGGVQGRPEPPVFVGIMRNRAGAVKVEPGRDAALCYCLCYRPVPEGRALGSFDRWKLGRFPGLLQVLSEAGGSTFAGRAESASRALDSRGRHTGGAVPPLGQGAKGAACLAPASAPGTGLLTAAPRSSDPGGGGSTARTLLHALDRDANVRRPAGWRWL